jgi:MoaA/NifB/PqqE/SkfB family radical SAM enzyme
MTFEQQLELVKQQYDVLSVIELDQWHQHPTYSDSQSWLEKQCRQIRQDQFADNQRIVFVHRNGDFYVKNQSTGLILRNLQIILNEIDVTCYFVILLSANPEIETELNYLKAINTDNTSVTGIRVETDTWNKIALDKHPSTVKEIYKYGSSNPLKISLNELSTKEKDLLTQSKVFCIYPWIHLNANPDGRAYPCCMTEHSAPVGDCKQNTLSEIWNNDPMKKIRLDMINETPITGCQRCYEQEQSGFFSGRQSANKHHGHHIDRVLETQPDGKLDRFEMVYWDIRYSNLCNLKCRSCGHIYSSQWYQDQAKLAGPEWAKNNRVLNYAGRTETDMWEQLIPHLDYVEQIYFAGGEPLMMEEHYNILDELDRRGRFDVRLIYNTNFTHIKLKDRTVFDYWKKFHSVSVGASLDAMEDRGEYIRKGTNWSTVEHNRRLMMDTCPNVDFYVSSTLSIMNAWHLPDFHRDWVQKGLVNPQDWNINILLDPRHYRLDIAPLHYKEKIREKFQQHLEWLKPLDQLHRATQGYESAINMMMATDNTKLLSRFWKDSQALDQIRRENLLEIIPELADIQL